MPPHDRIKIPLVVDDGAVIPQYQTPGSAGMDIFSTHAVELAPGGRAMIGTGLKMAIPNGYEGQIRPRSGLAARHGIALINSPGTIDPDFRGELKILVINLGDLAVQLGTGERIAQLVICPVVKADWQQVEYLDDTERGEGGFGSTGTK